ncbi:MAG TPA: vanadium-dependent haloperoxidase [Acidobacteriaceae bacterium]|nr:vanadium-dependent haloperoxidase [Acidobacteriaceae bacterium]
MATPRQPSLRPLWGEVCPWLMQSGDQFRPAPPPAFGSPEFDAAVAEVRAISDHRTPEQLRIALFWADGAGTFTPPGHWNAIAADLVARHHLDERRAALTFTLLNTAVMDAGIACWDAKYHYWLIRPPEVDPAITTPVGLPNFPSYTSGHATFSGAASEVLGSLSPPSETAFARWRRRQRCRDCMVAFTTDSTTTWASRWAARSVRLPSSV